MRTFYIVSSLPALPQPLAPAHSVHYQTAPLQEGRATGILAMRTQLGLLSLKLYLGDCLFTQTEGKETTSY